MTAAVVGDRGVQVREVPAPRPKANEILVKVRAASLNRADLAVAAGHQHGPMGGPGTIPGLEWAGEVAEVGTEVEGFRPGDRVRTAREDPTRTSRALFSPLPGSGPNPLR